MTMRITVALFALVLALLGIGALAEPADGGGFADVVAEYAVADDRGSSIRVRWGGAADRPVDIHAVASPDAPPTDANRIASEVRGGEWTQQHPTGRRTYFVLVDSAAPARQVRVAPRLLPLEGGRNFRDLGGYRTTDGRTVKWGRVFRSGVMTGITDADYDYLRELGIRVVCDLRSVEEREREPTVWGAGDSVYLAWNYSNEASVLREMFEGGEVTAERTRRAMLDLYHDIAYQHADRYTAMFDRLAAGDAPLAFNCSAGKDRTGVGAALLLTALGVPRDTVLEDYGLSDDYVDYLKAYRQPAEALPVKEGPYDFLRRLPAETVAPLMASDPAYLAAAFDRIERDHGSVMNFITHELAVSGAELEAIRDLLLTPSSG